MQLCGSLSVRNVSKKKKELPQRYTSVLQQTQKSFKLPTALNKYFSSHRSLSKLWEIVKNRETWCAAILGLSKSQTWLEQLNNTSKLIKFKKNNFSLVIIFETLWGEKTKQNKTKQKPLYAQSRNILSSHGFLYSDLTRLLPSWAPSSVGASDFQPRDRGKTGYRK